jgi:hypothetical protein
VKFLIAALAACTLAPLAHADFVCEELASIHQRAGHCYQNLEFIAPARKCAEEYSALMSATQAKLRKALASQVKAGNGAAQNGNFATNGGVLADSREELTYVIAYGKELHTELEDYVNNMNFPIWAESDVLDPSDPATKQEYRTSPCYGIPARAIEAMELQIRPWIADLEKAKAQVVAMANATSTNDTNLNSLNGSSAARTGAAGSPAAAVPAGRPKQGSSTITGAIKNENLK